MGDSPFYDIVSRLKSFLRKEVPKIGDNPYYDVETIQKAVRKGKHRDAIGGLWDEMGLLQFEFMKKNGLLPSSKLIDIGCGSLRGGVHYINYLDQNGYYGIDINQSLLDAGWKKELVPKKLHHKIDKSHLLASEDFQFEKFGVDFDFAISISLFTHLAFNTIRRCLRKIRPCLKDDTPYFATFFLADEASQFEDPLYQLGKVVTHSHKDPYHYSKADLQRLAEDSGFNLEIIGDWNNPANQKMVCFTKCMSSNESGPKLEIG